LLGGVAYNLRTRRRGWCVVSLMRLVCLVCLVGLMGRMRLVRWLGSGWCRCHAGMSSWRLWLLLWLLLLLLLLLWWLLGVKGRWSRHGHHLCSPHLWWSCGGSRRRVAVLL